MTVLVGMLCRDGVVIGADSSSTFSANGYTTIEQPTNKIKIVNDHVITTATGAVGLAQRFNHIIDKCYSNKIFTNHHIDVAKHICAETIKDFHSTGINIQKIPLGALVAYTSNGNNYLIEFETGTFQPEFKTPETLWYVSMGCGQPIADPFLGLMRRAFFPDKPPTLATGKFITAWCLQHTIDVNPGGVNGPFRLATLAPDRKGKYCTNMMEDVELAEHSQNIEEAEKHLGSFSSAQTCKIDPPDIPTI